MTEASGFRMRCPKCGRYTTDRDEMVFIMKQGYCLLCDDTGHDAVQFEERGTE